MRFGKLTALTGVLLVMLVVIYGCSDDKTTSTPAVTYGSLDDPVFVPIKAQIDNEVDQLLTDMLSGFDNMYVMPGDTSSVRAQLTPPLQEPEPDADPDTLIADFQDGWYFVYATYTGEVYHSRIADSIMYCLDGLPVERPTGGIDYIHFISSWTFTALDPTVTHVNFTGRNDFQFSNLDHSVSTINGNTVNTVEVVQIDPDITETNVFGFFVTVSNLNVPKESGGWYAACPQSGTLNFTLSHISIESWTGGAVYATSSAEWTVTVGFNNGTATVTASNGEGTWRYTSEVCTIGN